MAMSKVQITIDERLLEKIENYCDVNFLSRSGFFAHASREFLSSHEVARSLMELNVTLKRIADNNEIDEQTKSELEQFQATYNLLFSRK